MVEEVQKVVTVMRYHRVGTITTTRKQGSEKHIFDFLDEDIRFSCEFIQAYQGDLLEICDRFFRIDFVYHKELQLVEISVLEIPEPKDIWLQYVETDPYQEQYEYTGPQTDIPLAVARHMCEYFGMLNGTRLKELDACGLVTQICSE